MGALRAASWILFLFLIGLPILWVWPARGVIASYYGNSEWQGEPIATRVERQLSLATVAADPETFPQRQFSVQWTGWIRIDRAGTHTFATRSDDGSALLIDDQQVVDNGGVHSSRKRTGAIALTPGFHRLHVQYMQTEGAYDFSVSWTPPGAAEATISSDHLFVRRPMAAVGYLTPHVSLLWGLSWFASALVVAARIARSEREITSRDLRTFAFKAALAAASSIFTLVLIEAGLRVARYVGEDRRDLQTRLDSAANVRSTDARHLGLGDIVQSSRYEGMVYELKPNVRGMFEGQPLAVNSHGFRDFDYPVAKPPGVIRIVGLGDSSLFGWGVRLEDSTLKVLEKKLNDGNSSQKFEVLNLAVPGYNTAMEAEMLVRRGLDYDPDVVLVGFNTNDYEVPPFMKVSGGATAWRDLLVFDVALSAYERLMGEAEREVPQFDFANRSLSLEEAARLDEDPALPDEYRYMVGAKGFVRAMDKVVATAGERGIPVVVFDVKAYPGLHPTYRPNEFRDSQRELLERLSKERGFHFLNTYPHYVEYMNRHPDAPYPRVFAVSDADSHPNPLAHAINADALYVYLKSQRIIP